MYIRAVIQSNGGELFYSFRPEGMSTSPRIKMHMTVTTSNMVEGKPDP